MIFEMAADIHPASMRTFMLVARRVKDLVRPLLYRTISVCERQADIPEGYPFFHISTLLDMIHSGNFPGDAVRNLSIQVGSKDDRITLLSACPQTENLSIYTHLWPKQFASISGLPLKRLKSCTSVPKYRILPSSRICPASRSAVYMNPSISCFQRSADASHCESWSCSIRLG
ncbi:hypothetical protein B0H12DRAFT_159333 [Mycena haematopus]|nr:hypothetical protein B0H12DRAFT_159333 [Mycena haematopus]